MCRMLAFRASGSGLMVASKLVRLLSRASMHDPYLEALTGDGRHCDGYGYVAALKFKDNGAWTIIYERFGADPLILGEEACTENLDRLEEASRRLSELIGGAVEATVIMHSRKASSKPYGSIAAHPYREEALLRFNGEPLLGEIYLAHNGGVSKYSLIRELGLEGFIDSYTDSHLLLKYIASRLSGSEIGSIPGKLARGVLDKAKNNTRPGSALNLAIMILPRHQDPLLLAYSHIEDTANQAKWDYYKPIIAWTQDITAYISSTIWDLAIQENIQLENHIVLQGELAILHKGKPPEIIKNTTPE